MLELIVYVFHSHKLSLYLCVKFVSSTNIVTSASSVEWLKS